MIDEYFGGYKMEKFIQPSEKTIAFVENVFEQGDSRYLDYESAYFVAYFIENKGIEVTKKVIEDRFNPSNEELHEITPPQRLYKFIGLQMLQRYGYKLICFEGSLPSGRTDILAKHSHYNERLAVECQSCRTDKAIKYLKEEKMVLWVLCSQSRANFINQEIELFMFRRGPNWDNCLRKLKKNILSRIKEIKSPLDSL